MAYARITAENAHTFENGTEVEFNYGPMHGSEIGYIVGIKTNRFGTQLAALTEDGEVKYISGFSDIGVGVYLKG